MTFFCRLRKRCTNTVKSLSPDTMTMVFMCGWLTTTSKASSAIRMSARFLAARTLYIWIRSIELLSRSSRYREKRLQSP